MSRFFATAVLFAALLACSNKKDDSSAPDGDTDTDTDSDTDSDSDADADTDTDSDTDFSATIHFRASNQSGSGACEATVELTGTPYSGSCPSCEFAFAVTGDVTSGGASCDYEDYSPAMTYLTTDAYENVYLAFSSSTKDGYTNMLRAGFTYAGGKAPYWVTYVYDDGTNGTATYGSHLLEWTVDYMQVGEQLATIEYCGGPYAGNAGVTNYGGSYVDYGTWKDCRTFPYDLWSFTARADEVAYISVDTTSATTTVDTEFFVMDATSCFLGDADDSFECTYPPAQGSCPSYALPVAQGDDYFVLVHSYGSCAAATGEYKLSISHSDDPMLTLVESDQPFFAFERIHVEGTANIP